MDPVKHEIKSEPGEGPASSAALSAAKPEADMLPKPELKRTRPDTIEALKRFIAEMKDAFQIPAQFQVTYPGMVGMPSTHSTFRHALPLGNIIVCNIGGYPRRGFLPAECENSPRSC